MTEEIRAPVLSYEDIRRRADDFLARHHPDGTIPVPVEEIVEFQLGMDIVPVPGLRAVIEAEGFTTGDLREIHVAADASDRHHNRYRFTLAHEVGHVVLHGEVFRKGQKGTWSSIDGWKTFVDSISDEQHASFEYQAYSFGGLVLVPRDDLIREAKECVDRIEIQGLAGSGPQVGRVVSPLGGIGPPPKLGRTSRTSSRSSASKIARMSRIERTPRTSITTGTSRTFATCSTRSCRPAGVESVRS